MRFTGPVTSAEQISLGAALSGKTYILLGNAAEEQSPYI